MDNEGSEGSFLVDFLVFYRVQGSVPSGAHLECPGRSFWVPRELILGTNLSSAAVESEPNQSFWVRMSSAAVELSELNQSLVDLC